MVLSASRVMRKGGRKKEREKEREGESKKEKGRRGMIHLIQDKQDEPLSGDASSSLTREGI